MAATPEPARVISSRQLSKHFTSPAETIKAVNELDLEVHTGDFVALMGPSGCGKSTLLNLFAGLVDRDSGSLEILGQDPDDLSADQLSTLRLRSIGLVFQDHRLIDEFTSLENVLLPLEVTDAPQEETVPAAELALARVGISEKRDVFPNELSGGQKQRVGIARAIAGNKPLVLADEPTGSLDYENTRAVFSILQSMARSGVAVMVATHDDTVLDFASRVLRMRDGQIHSDQKIERSEL